MRRTLVQFDEPTYQALRRRAHKEARSMASIVRDLVKHGLALEPEPPGDIRAFRSVGAGRSRPRGRVAVSEAHDEALADAFTR